MLVAAGTPVSHQKASSTSEALSTCMKRSLVLKAAHPIISVPEPRDPHVQPPMGASPKPGTSPSMTGRKETLMHGSPPGNALVRAFLVPCIPPVRSHQMAACKRYRSASSYVGLCS